MMVKSSGVKAVGISGKDGSLLKVEQEALQRSRISAMWARSAEVDTEDSL